MKIDKNKIMQDQRELMIKDHLIARGIKDRRVLDVMGRLQREMFVPPKYIVDSYGDHPIPIGYNQTISQPYIVALMSELCEFTGNEKVLEIGSGSGYQSAVLSSLADKVFSIERIKELVKEAEKNLRELGCNNVKIIHNDGFKGLDEEAPFDVILLTAAPVNIPHILEEQLSDGGRLIAPVGDAVQQLIRMRKISGEVTRETITYVSFVPMLEGFN